MRKFIATIFLILLTQQLMAQVENQMEVPGMSSKDIIYANVDGLDLALDIYMPESVENPPLVVYVHGGAWQRGTKNSESPLQFVEHGFALASIDFRQSTQAHFPAQIHDIKAAVRFLRANANSYGINASKIAIAGNSSGAHLATLVGVSNGHAELEGSLGDHLNTSSDVQSILSYFGAHDLTSILGQSTLFGLGVRVPALQLLLGGQPEEEPELAQLASPVFHAEPSDPPLLLLHGDQDRQMPIDQSYQMETAYKELGLDVVFDVVIGAGHGGQEFYEPVYLERAITFLRRTIGNN
ncbi:MAG: alpha/beta hydrolase [Gammaproteobacteria bacterium]|jgi:acetyl esterase/lipase|nr:alpha/beta hydrolase [Gammaproteobacteria bacterium]